MANTPLGAATTLSVAGNLALCYDAIELETVLPTGQNLVFALKDEYFGKIIRATLTYSYFTDPLNEEYTTFTESLTAVAPALDADLGSNGKSVHESFYDTFIRGVVTKVNGLLSPNQTLVPMFDSDTQTAYIASRTEHFLDNIIFEEIKATQLGYDADTDTLSTSDGLLLATTKDWGENVDFDTLVYSGTAQTAGLCPNSPAPDAETSWSVAVTLFADGNVHQLATDLAQSMAYRRHYVSGVWDNWWKYADDADVQYLSDTKANLDFSNTNLYTAVADNTDFDTLTANGTYFAIGTCPNSPHPTDDERWTVEVLTTETGGILQRVSSEISSVTEQRLYKDGAWADYSDYIGIKAFAEGRKYRESDVVSTVGEDAYVSLYRSLVAENGALLDDVNSWKEIALRGTLPIGTLIDVPSNSTYSNDMLVPCDGTQYSRSDFPELYDEYLSPNNTAPASQWQTFVQPTLSANGTVGGDAFAVSASSEYSTSYYAYFAFNSVSDATNVCWISTSGVLTGWLCFYNPNPLRVRRLVIQNRAQTTEYSMSRSGSIEGSNDNENWDLITDYTNDNIDAGGVWGIDVNATEGYTYYRINGTSTASFLAFGEVWIEADEYVGEEEEFSFTGDLATCTYAEYDEYVSTWGYCDKFAVDLETEKFKVPTARPHDRKLVKAYSLGDEGYNLYDDGYLEQWGMQGALSVSNITIYLHLEYINEAYNIQLGRKDATGQTLVALIVEDNVFTTHFVVDPQVAYSYQYWWTAGYSKDYADLAKVNTQHIVLASGVRSGVSTKDLTSTGEACRTAIAAAGEEQLAKILITDGTRSLFEMVRSSTPQADSCLHLADGALLTDDMYADAIARAKTLYESLDDITVYKTFEQPILSENGTVGGDDFAVEASSQYSTTYYAYKAFDGVRGLTTNDSAWITTSAVISGWLTMYNPTPLRVSKFGMYNRLATTYGPMISGSVEGSNNNEDWDVLVGSFTNTNTDSANYWEITVNSEAFYKYYRITGASAATYLCVGEVEIHAVEETPEYVTKESTFCTEDYWQATVAEYGVCDMYVYDPDANTLRLPQKANPARKLVKAWVEDTEGYNLYSDGWCEQWGETKSPSTTANATWTTSFHIPYLNAYYDLMVSKKGHAVNTLSSTTFYTRPFRNKTTTGFMHSLDNNTYIASLDWRAKGFVSTPTNIGESEYNYIVVGTNVISDINIVDITTVGEEQIEEVKAEGATQRDEIETMADEQLAKILVSDGTRSPFELVVSTSLQTDQGLHLADGTALDTVIYRNFIDLAKAKAEAGAEEFITELDWQKSVATYGVCGKYVYEAEHEQTFYGVIKDVNDIQYYIAELPEETVEGVALYNADFELVAVDTVVTVDASTGAITVTSATLDITCTRIDDTTDQTRTIPELLRIPLITGFIEGTTSDVGGLNEAGLPNITGSFSANINTRQTSSLSGTGAFLQSTSSITNWTASTGTNYYNILPIFNASDSNSIYGNSDTVQPQSIKLYYYIVVGTQTTTDITIVDITSVGEEQIENIEAATDEQLSRILLTDGTRAPFELVESTTSQGDSALHLADGTILNAEIYSAFIALAKAKAEAGAEEFTTELAWQTHVAAYGVCSKYVYEAARDQQYFGVVEDTTETVYYLATIPEETVEAVGIYDAEGTLIAFDGVVTTASDVITVTSVTLDIACTRVDDAHDHTIAKPESLRIPCLSSPLRKLVKREIDGTDGYNLYSDGWCEQWGMNTSTSTSNVVITLPVEYLDINYNIVIGDKDATGTTATAVIVENTIYTTSFTIDPQIAARYTYWQTQGYATVPTEYFNDSYQYIVMGTQTTTDVTIVDLTSVGEEQVENIEAAADAQLSKILLTDGTRSPFELIESTTLQEDAALHLADGEVLTDNIYGDFIALAKAKFEAGESTFCTEEEWQASIDTYGVCGKYVYDTSANTVRLPLITGKVHGILSNAGGTVEAGLPNITGSFGRSASIGIGGGTGAVGEGCFTLGDSYTSGCTTSTTTGYWFKFDASLSNTIYGNSETVTEQAVTIYYYIVVGTQTTTDVTVVDITVAGDEQLERIEDKGEEVKAELQEIIDEGAVADTSLSNLAVLNETIVEEYASASGVDWYIIYKRPQSDGTVKYYCKQGGYQTGVDTSVADVSFLVALNETPRNVNCTTYNNDSTSYITYLRSYPTSSQLKIKATTEVTGVFWSVEGYCNEPSAD